VVALAALLFHRGPRFVPALVLLVLMLGATAFQAFVIEPKAAEIKTRIASFETTSKDDPLRREFSRLHGISAVCNLVVFVGGVALVLLQRGS